jgi:hypothetical protein
MLAPMLLIVGLLSGPILQDRASTGSIKGSVQDATGAVLAAASVVVIDASSTVVADTKTDPSGTFIVDALAPGTYQIRCEFPGFEPRERQVVVTAGRRTTLSAITLQIAGVMQDITVGREPSAVDVAADANRDAIVFGADDLRNLPTFDRDIVGTLSRFLDAGSLGAGGATLVVDGIEARKVGVSPAAIAEIKVNQDPYAAEFQRPGRGRIEVVTKAGSDAYHGSFDFTFRDAQLNARDVFAPTKPPEQRRIYEGVLGGPIADGKHTSFLVTLERRDEDLQAIVYAAGPSGLVDAVVPRPSRGTEVSASWTHQAGASQTYTVRFTGETQHRSNQGVGGTTLPEAGSDSRSDEEQIVVGHRWVLSRAALSDFRVLVGREIGSTVSLTPGVRLVVADAFTGGSAQADQRTSEYHVQLAQNLSYLKGKHLFKIGFAIPDLSRRGFDDRTNFGGTFTFASPADYVLGRPVSFLQQQGDGRIVFVQRVVSAFAQDQIAVSRAWSLGVGVRYDWQNIFTDNNNVAPRLSVAYALRRGTVLRAGAGSFYDRAGDGAIRDVLVSRQARLQRVLIVDPSYPNPFGGETSGGSLVPSIVVLERGIRIPYTVQYSVGIDHEIRKGTTASINYVGGRGVGLFRSRDVNAPCPPDYLERPNPAFGRVREIEAQGRQQANSLQVALRGRLSRRVQSTVQYTFGVVRNDTSGINALPANNYDTSGEYGRADFDQRHRIEALGQINGGAWLKFGVSFSAASGRPYSLTTGRDLFNTGQVTARPLGISRNTLVGPSTASLDLRWSREIRLSRSKKDDERAVSIGVSAFNLTNRVNFNSPIGNLSSPFFGRSISAQPPRQVQLSASVTF